MMNRLLQLVYTTSLAVALAQVRVTGGRRQRDSSGDSDLSLYITTDKVLDTSPIPGTSGIDTRSPFDVVLTNATTLAVRGTLIIAADSADANSCTMVYGTDFNGEVWEDFAYQKISTGSNCDTTASCETI